MENTNSFLFDNKDEKYFVAVHGRAVGPLTAQEVYERLQRNEASLLHYIWVDHWDDWKRIYEDPTFFVLIPQKPTSAAISQIREKLASRKKKTPPKPETDLRNYFAYYNKSQFGPFSKQEITHMIATGKLDPESYLWISGWPNWKRLAEVEEFQGLVPQVSPPAPPAPSGLADPNATVRLPREEPKPKAKKKEKEEHEPSLGVAIRTGAGVDASEKRIQPRRPMVARLFLHNDQDVIIAICRDISVGGMQVLTDRVPGPVGTKIKLNVSPSDSKSVAGFVAEGEIVRVLEDGRGFSFRFAKISDDARKAIEKYITLDQ